MSTDGSAVAERPTASSAPVLYEVSDSGVAVITLNRPERLNTWGGTMTSKGCLPSTSSRLKPNIFSAAGLNSMNVTPSFSSME